MVILLRFTIDKWGIDEMLIKIIKLPLQYIVGLIFAWGVVRLLGIVCVLCLMWYCKVFLPPPESPITFNDIYGDFIGGASSVFAIFVCIPIGAVFGILMTDNLILKHSKTLLLKITISLLIAILFSAVIFSFWAMSLILQYNIFASETRTSFFMLVFIPIGESLGILIADKVIFKHHKVFSLNIIISLLMGVLGSGVVSLIFPLLGIENTLTLYRVLPSLGINTEEWMRATKPACDIYLFLTCGGDEAYFLISTLFALIGYNVVVLFKCKKDKSVICN